jgi:hypothetical protein
MGATHRIAARGGGRTGMVPRIRVFQEGRRHEAPRESGEQVAANN